jgi:hypothetical protein
MSITRSASSRIETSVVLPRLTGPANSSAVPRSAGSTNNMGSDPDIAISAATAIAGAVFRLADQRRVPAPPDG